MSLDIANYEDAARTVIAPDEPLSLVRVGSAVLFHAGDRALRVTGPTVAFAQVKMEARLSHWLQANGVPTIPALSTHQGGTYAVTVMPWMEPVRTATTDEVATAMARMHTLAAPPWLRRFDPLAVTRARISELVRHGRLTASEHQTISQGLARAEAVWSSAGGTVVVVHGDLTCHNVLVTSDGPQVHDLENAGVGPVAWDLVRDRHAATRFADPQREQGTFVDTYRAAGGQDVTPEALDPLVTIVDLIGAVWCMAGRQLDPERFAEEAQTRLETVATAGRTGSTWTPR